MSQFDVFANPGRQATVIPYVAVLQNGRFNRASIRFVAPLVRADGAQITEHYPAPRFTVQNTEVVLDLFNLANLPADRLGRPVARLDDEESRTKLIRALDEFITQD